MLMPYLNAGKCLQATQYCTHGHRYLMILELHNINKIRHYNHNDSKYHSSNNCEKDDKDNNNYNHNHNKKIMMSITCR